MTRRPWWWQVTVIAAVVALILGYAPAVGWWGGMATAWWQAGFVEGFAVGHAQKQESEQMNYTVTGAGDATFNGPYLTQGLDGNGNEYWKYGSIYLYLDPGVGYNLSPTPGAAQAVGGYNPPPGDRRGRRPLGAAGGGSGG